MAKTKRKKNKKVSKRRNGIKLKRIGCDFSKKTFPIIVYGSGLAKVKSVKARVKSGKNTVKLSVKVLSKEDASIKLQLKYPKRTANFRDGVRTDTDELEITIDEAVITDPPA